MAPDPEYIFSRLSDLFPWAERANEVVCRQLSICRMGRGYAYINPLLLVGEPGVGKTRYSHELAKLLGVPMVYYGAGGSSDSMLLKGSARGWRDTRPSLAIETICQHNIANPIMLIDEIDKVGSGNQNGRVEDYLHSVLEPSSARNVLDECLMVPANLSAVTWILTANYKDRLSSSLLSRLTSIVIPSPGKKHFSAVVRGVVRSVIDESGINDHQIPDIPDDLWETFLRSAVNPRMLRKMVELWLGEAGRHITMQ
jgi:ATP-dependent Lon protease